MKLIRIVAVLLLLPLSGWAGTFIETFNDDDLEAWQELVQEDEGPGSWEVINRELHAVSADGWPRLLTIGNKKWQDYTIEVDVKPLEKHRLASIVIAARIKGTWLVFCEVGDRPFGTPNAICRTGDFHTNQSQLLYIGNHPLLKLNDWSTLKLSVKGETFSFWINDERITETGGDFALVLAGRALFEGKVGSLDGFLLTGGAGFGVANYNANFDNVIITGKDIPDKGKLPVASKGKLATTWGNLKQF